MATSDQIGRAAGRDRMPVGAEYMMSDHLLAMPAADREYALQEIARATRSVHRIAVDQQAASDVLQALGLIPYQYEPEPRPAPEKECRRCHLPKTVDQFNPEKRHRDGLGSYCKTCRGELRKKYPKRRGMPPPVTPEQAAANRETLAAATSGGGYRTPRRSPATGQATDQNGI